MGSKRKGRTGKAGKAGKKKRADKPERVDGLGPQELKHIRRVLRQAWSWSHAWRLVKKRAMGADGFPRCEGRTHGAGVSRRVPKVFVDHIRPLGVLTTPDNPLYRLFVPSRQLQALCKRCHDAKTRRDKKREEREAKKWAPPEHVSSRCWISPMDPLTEIAYASIESEMPRVRFTDTF